MPILTGFGPNPRGPKSGQGKLADLDALVLLTDSLELLQNALFLERYDTDAREARPEIRLDFLGKMHRPSLHIGHLCQTRLYRTGSLRQLRLQFSS